MLELPYLDYHAEASILEFDSRTSMLELPSGSKWFQIVASEVVRIGSCFSFKV